MATPEPIAAAELHECCLNTIREALIGGGDDGRELLAQLNRAELFICWSDPWLAYRSSRALAYPLIVLLSHLRRQADAYAADGMHISDRDCLWLAAKLTGGALQLVTRARVDEAREAQAAQRRGRDLNRWQQQAEARVGFA